MLSSVFSFALCPFYPFIIAAKREIFLRSAGFSPLQCPNGPKRNDCIVDLRTMKRCERRAPEMILTRLVLARKRWAGPTRVLRGGSWNNDHPTNLSGSYRNHNTPDNRDNNIGFRVVLALRVASP